ncbi:Regulator of protease activity HflC, stomatin/prohibitin superfamily [Sporobacter termitidis DSM 10068]|uniref:Regulator of protease activity HflC, stomatin/prohibitin superfamily n=1 Tax=Sporobacter termitidis DSM 10068 TaxID=1123282 RepID=A0A1M5YEX8_9FIRM|nr:SPFH domain-containing protein [Sporobacter termitidis]SHI10459.1 Regulator of protease activity HflC, stomatin/prohibitin superfamily [Sporobacter termitidis DSM 10068]
MYAVLVIGAIVVCAVFFAGVRIIRPSRRGLVETFGRSTRYLQPGFHWIVPLVQKAVIADLSERMLTLGPLLVITSDNLSANASAAVTVRLRDGAESVRAAVYNAGNYLDQTASMARTALLDVVGGTDLKSLGCCRKYVSEEFFEALRRSAAPLGVEIVRAEVTEIEFTADIRASLHSTVLAANEKTAAADFAAAAKMTAEGMKRADIIKAEGKKQARVLAAEGEAKAIRLICEASRHYAAGSAQLLRIVETALGSGGGGLPPIPEYDSASEEQTDAEQTARAGNRAV